ncbi:WhiB family transcriptional regulator [Streptomyces sp. NPDC046859]|uniref:WhiB family transcriptional regulator n=1 Tax=Streptomyces sp. NPDC046859 TaxID=3155734 RepID=UPI0033E7ACF3
MTPAVPDGGSRLWELRAACREWDAELWFTRRTWPLAVAICALCPVLEPCRDAVLRRERGLPRCRRQGVVAGLTGPQRHALEQTGHSPGALPAPPSRRPVAPDSPPGPVRPALVRRAESGPPAAPPVPAPPTPPTPATPLTPPAPAPPGPPAPEERNPPDPGPPPSGPRSGADEADPPAPDRRTAERGGDTPSRIRPAPCGTRAAYQRHLRRGEPVDAACRAANTYEAGRYRRTGSTRARVPRPPA